MNIDEFIQELTEYKSSDTVFNMYSGDSAAAKKCRENLRKYLEQHKNTQILLVGEAPGYKGCAKTGVPFTSDSGEVSSKVLQEAINKYNPGIDVLMWNAFPFHPHKKGDLESNRRPTKSELEIGQKFLDSFLKVFPSVTCVASVGNVAKELLEKFEFEYRPNHICHPSYGHKKQCEEDTYGALFRFSLILNDEQIMKEVASCAGKEYEDAAYHYLKEHNDEFFHWYNASDHIEYAHAYWQLHKDIDLSEYRKKLK
ncbi:uracil-DNA glycosylase [Candidatus Saccharibacteria bacterium]|nr:uracil-DNA glycosylase [Candidatus Saccharibacteria bacterium]